MDEKISMSFDGTFLQSMMADLVRQGMQSGFADYNVRNTVAKMISDSVTNPEIMGKIQAMIQDWLRENTISIVEMVTKGTGEAVVAMLREQQIGLAVETIYTMRNKGRYLGSEMETEERNRIRAQLLGLPDPDPDGRIASMAEEHAKEERRRNQEISDLRSTIDEYRNFWHEMASTEGGKLEIKQAEERIEARAREHEKREKRAIEPAATSTAPDSTPF